MIDLILEDVDMFIENANCMEFVERENIDTLERDVAIRIAGQEYSFLQFMQKVKHTLLHMKDRQENLTEHIRTLNDRIRDLNRYNDISQDLRDMERHAEDNNILGQSVKGYGKVMHTGFGGSRWYEFADGKVKTYLDLLSEGIENPPL